jgi:natural resistance-associated macrophage protein
MPHNIYLHSSLVLTRKIDNKDLNKVNEANIYNILESSISLFISFLISSAVIITFAAYKISNPTASQELDLLTASDALKESFGDSAKYIWAIGLLAAG